MWLYCDDTSGNLSKKWNEHNSFLFTPAALPLEMLDGILDQLDHQSAHRTEPKISRGASLHFVLQGVLFCQFVNYYTWYRDETRSLQCIVAVLIATVLRSIQLFGLIWINFIQHFGDVKGAIMLNYTAWIWIVGPIALLFLFAFVAMAVATYFISRSAAKEITMWSLYLDKEGSLPQTAGLINALVRLTFQTAVPGALWYLRSLPSFPFAELTRHHSRRPGPDFNRLQHDAAQTLRDIDDLDTQCSPRNTNGNSKRRLKNSSNGSPGSRSRGPRRVTDSDVELGPIQVLTQTTETHIVRRLVVVVPIFENVVEERQSQGSEADLASY
ncbi:hypothetical protein C8J57DRAFT_1250282 [Mycena rebaudengoi]|nr:hypothetical protein C8J57DRAFT_1250282 [Mycena rebaudengoi]